MNAFTNRTDADCSDTINIINDRITLNEEEIKALCVVVYIFMQKMPKVMIVAYKMFRACGSPMTGDAYDLMTVPAVSLAKLEKVLTRNGWSAKEID